MLFKPKLKSKNKRPVAFIYAVVFNSTFSVLLVFMLFASFAIQPIHQAYANEVEAQLEQVPEMPITDEVEEQPVVSADEEILPVLTNDDIEVSEEDVVNEIIETVETDTGEEDTNADELNLTSSITDVEEESGSSDDSDISVVDEESDIAEELIETDSTADDGSVVETAVNNELRPTIATATASTTETLVPVEAQPLVTDDNYYQFSKTSCVAIGDGTFHCSSNSGSEINSQTVVYADFGASQNMEIFLKTTKGTIKQLTDNEFDDTSPSYDPETRQIVWQRLIDSRYQIILYDIDEETESQLTFSRTNNMEPKISKSGIVWQSWDNNDWEIMFFDGKYTDQITKNDLQDVAPAIHDGYILWSVLGGEEQEARVFSLESGEILNINGYEGGIISNPRFVLVYDTKYDNGDIVTQGFDPQTGLSAPISAKPAPKPIDIPDTDSTGETRALIQNKSTQKNDIVVTGDKKATSTDANPNLASDISVSTSTLDLTASNNPDSVNLGVDASTTTALELTDFDLILLPGQPADATNTASTSNE